ncbi:hypothetical protein K2W90_03320 [Candidatus Babeliales bacterium]|nr:hypothetical protein [Candidatus Babeliales bacterium]
MKKLLLFLFFSYCTTNTQAATAPFRRLAIFLDHNRAEAPTTASQPQSAVAVQCAIALNQKACPILVANAILFNLLACKAGNLAQFQSDFIKAVDLKLAEWDFYHPAPNLFLLVPKGYVATETVSLPNIKEVLVTVLKTKNPVTQTNLGTEVSNSLTNAKDLHTNLIAELTDILNLNGINSTKFEAAPGAPALDLTDVNLAKNLQPWNMFINGHGTVEYALAGIPVELMTHVALLLNKLNVNIVYVRTCSGGGKNLQYFQFKKDIDDSKLPINLDYTLVMGAVTDATVTSQTMTQIGFGGTTGVSWPKSSDLHYFFEQAALISEQKQKPTVKKAKPVPKKKKDWTNSFKKFLKEVSLYDDWYTQNLGINSIPQALIPNIGWFTAFDIDPALQILSERFIQTTAAQNKNIDITDKHAVLIYPKTIAAPITIAPKKAIKKPLWIQDIPPAFTNWAKAFSFGAPTADFGSNTFYPTFISMIPGNATHILDNIQVGPGGVLHFIRDSFLNLQDRSSRKTFYINTLTGPDDAYSYLGKPNQGNITLSNVVIQTWVENPVFNERYNVNLYFMVGTDYWALELVNINLAAQGSSVWNQLAKISTKADFDKKITVCDPRLANVEKLLKKARKSFERKKKLANMFTQKQTERDKAVAGKTEPELPPQAQPITTPQPAPTFSAGPLGNLARGLQALKAKLGQLGQALTTLSTGKIFVTTPPSIPTQPTPPKKTPPAFPPATQYQSKIDNVVSSLIKNFPTTTTEFEQLFVTLGTNLNFVFDEKSETAAALVRKQVSAANVQTIIDQGLAYAANAPEDQALFINFLANLVDLEQKTDVPALIMLQTIGKQPYLPKANKKDLLALLKLAQLSDTLEKATTDTSRTQALQAISTALAPLALDAKNLYMRFFAQKIDVTKQEQYKNIFKDICTLLNISSSTLWTNATSNLDFYSMGLAIYRKTGVVDSNWNTRIFHECKSMALNQAHQCFAYALSSYFLFTSYGSSNDSTTLAFIEKVINNVPLSNYDKADLLGTCSDCYTNHNFAHLKPLYDKTALLAQPLCVKNYDPKTTLFTLQNDQKHLASKRRNQELLKNLVMIYLTTDCGTDQNKKNYDVVYDHLASGDWKNQATLSRKIAIITTMVKKYASKPGQIEELYNKVKADSEIIGRLKSTTISGLDTTTKSLIDQLCA